jgi:hypothetical protein
MDLTLGGCKHRRPHDAERSQDLDDRIQMNDIRLLGILAQLRAVAFFSKGARSRHDIVCMGRRT